MDEGRVERSEACGTPDPSSDPPYMPSKRAHWHGMKPPKGFHLIYIYIDSLKREIIWGKRHF